MKKHGDRNSREGWDFNKGIDLLSPKSAAKYNFRRAVVNKVRSIDLHGCLNLRRNKHFFQTSWTDFSKRTVSLVGGGMLEHAVTRGLAVWGAKCRGLWWLGQGCLFSPDCWDPQH